MYALQRRKVAVVPVHRDVVDLAAGARGQEVRQVDVRIGAVAAGGGAAEVHRRRRRSRRTPAFAPLACSAGQAAAAACGVRFDCALKFGSLKPSRYFEPGRDRAVDRRAAPDHRHELDAGVAAAAREAPVVPPANGRIERGARRRVGRDAALARRPGAAGPAAPPAPSAARRAGRAAGGFPPRPRGPAAGAAAAPTARRWSRRAAAPVPPRPPRSFPRRPCPGSTRRSRGATRSRGAGRSGRRRSSRRSARCRLRACRPCRPYPWRWCRRRSRSARR